MKKIIALAVALLLVLPLAIGCTTNPTSTGTGTGTTAPTTKPTTKPATEPTDDAVTIYVATNGDDGAAGTKEAPLATISAAVNKAVSQAAGTDVIISVDGGRYNVSETITISANELASLTINGNSATLTGGIRIPASDFAKVDDEITARVPERARDSIVAVDLTKYGYNAEKYAKMNPADKMVFIDNTRLTLARYPDTTLMEFSDVYDDADSKPFILKFRSALMKELKKWADFDGMYVYGYPYYTWLSIYAEVGKVDFDTSTITMLDAGDGARKGGKVALVNLPEMLDYSNEFYIAPNGMLYIFAPDGIQGEYVNVPNSDVRFFNLQNVSNTTIDSLNMTDTFGMAVSASGKNITINNCEIARMYTVINLSGSDNTISNCNIHNISRHVIDVSGGDKITLTPSNNVVTNNTIKNFSESGHCYQSAVNVYGVGLTVSHNEIAGSNHMALGVNGNNNIVEYNDVHDVCTTSSDCGAFYQGRSNINGGNIFRYNFIHDVGTGTLISNGIYFDDCLSGQIAYGNVISGCTGNGFLVGGGRANVIEGNLIVSCRNSSIEYDARGYEGQFGNGSWKKIVDFSYETFQDERLINDTWKEAFPWLFAATITENPDPDDANWLCAPGGSTVKKNVYVITDRYGDIAAYDAADDEGKVHFKDHIFDVVYRFSDVDTPEIVKAELETYTLDEIAKLNLPDYLDIPFDKIGLLK